MSENYGSSFNPFGPAGTADTRDSLTLLALLTLLTLTGTVQKCDFHVTFFLALLTLCRVEADLVQKSSPFCGTKQFGMCFGAWSMVCVMR